VLKRAATPRLFKKGNLMLVKVSEGHLQAESFQISWENSRRGLTLRRSRGREHGGAGEEDVL